MLVVVYGMVLVALLAHAVSEVGGGLGGSQKSTGTNPEQGSAAAAGQRHLTSDPTCPAPPAWPTRKAGYAGCPPGRIWSSFSSSPACKPVCSDAEFNDINIALSFRVDGPLGSSLSASVARSILAVVQAQVQVAYSQPTGDVYTTAPAFAPGTPGNVVAILTTFGSSVASQPRNPISPVRAI